MTATAYARARDRGSETLRRALLDTASRLLVKEGPQALTMRRVAAAAGCSTTVLYTVFGGKNGIAEGLTAKASRVSANGWPRCRPTTTRWRVSSRWATPTATTRWRTAPTTA